MLQTEPAAADNNNSSNNPLTSSPTGWNPPPHLEARLCKKRRRTGIHSPSSAAAAAAAPLTSSHLATTRRQTLLESRKSLLRQRAAHVEKVRRSRANSHEAVSERLLALQQNLSAAQNSRNAILAKIARSCANEVAKAKRLAGEMKARREEEARALRSGVEGRMLEAERRREEMLRERRGKRRERGSSASLKVDGSSEDDDVSDDLQKVRLSGKSQEEIMEDAARCVQRAWKDYRNRSVISRFTEIGLTIESVRDMGFEEVSIMFQEDRVQKATARLLKHCGLLKNSDGSDGEAGGADVEKACRTFLSAYLILGHPAEVLSNDGQDEKALITKSKDLLIAFESFLSSPTLPATYLSRAWSAFSKGFTAWKARDSAILINTMVAQYAELDLIWQKVKDDTVEHVAAEFREGIRENQLMLLVRIRRLAGERTRVLIRQAVKEARRTRLPRREKGDTRPRATPTAADGSSVSTVESSAASTTSRQSTDSLGSAPGPIDDASTGEQRGFPQLDDGMMSNRQIVHELALDRDFKLTPRKKGQVEKIVEEQARRAFWDIMREDVLERGELEKWIPGMAETVKGRLLRLLEPTGSLHRMISDGIDIQLIEQQCRMGSYDYERFFRFVLSILPKICSPARDEDVQSLVNDTGDYIHRLQRLLDVLELLQLDHANFLLMMSAQHVIPEAVPYERRLFEADLAAGRTALENVNKWLLKAKSEKLDEARSRDPGGADHPADRPTPIAIYNHAFLGLALSLDPLDLSTIPETFHLDIDRLILLRTEFKNIVRGAAICLTIKNLLRRDVRAAWKPLKERILTMLRQQPSTNKTPSEQAQEICTFVQDSTATPPAVQSHIKSSTTRILSNKPTTTTTDPVVRVVSNRLKNYVSVRLNAATAKERVKLAATGGDTLMAFGMAEWIADVGGVSERCVALAGLNRECYAIWYDRCLVDGAGGEV